MNTNKKAKRKWKQAIAMITASALVPASGIFGEVAFAKERLVGKKTQNRNIGQKLCVWGLITAVMVMIGVVLIPTTGRADLCII